MIEMLQRGCTEAGLAVDDLNLVVPHQANGRIIEAVRIMREVTRENLKLAIPRSSVTP